MNERALLEARFDGPVPEPMLAALRNLTPEQIRAAKLDDLKLDVAYHAAWRDLLVTAKPGDKVGSHENATEEWIVAERAANELRLEKAHEALIAYALVEANNACDRAELWLARAIRPVQVAE